MTIIRYIRSDWSSHITVSTRYKCGMGNTTSYADELDALYKTRYQTQEDEDVTKISFYYPFNFIGPLPPNG